MKRIRFSVKFILLLSLLYCNTARNECIVEKCGYEKDICEVLLITPYIPGPTIEELYAAGNTCREIEEECMKRCKKNYILGY